MSSVRTDKAIGFDETTSKYNETDFIWFEIDVTEQLKASKDDMVHLELTEYHKRRREPFPESVKIVED